MQFTYETPPVRVLFGQGTANADLPAEIERLGWKRIMLIASERESPQADEVARPFASLVAARFSGIRQHVPAAVADEVRRVATEARVDGLLCIGGGSTIGTAKIVALTSSLPIIAVPTTFSGSETTSIWGETRDGRKQTGRDPAVQPGTVIYDPLLTSTMPRVLAVASALNAMAHCVEVFWAPNTSPIVVLLATEGIAALAAGLDAIGQSPADATGLDSRANEKLLYGAYLAGSSFAVAGSGLHHKICHALGGAFDLPHAETHAVILPQVLAFNAPAIGEHAQTISRALGADDLTDPVAALRQLYSAVDAPRSLRELGLTEDQLEEAIDVVAEKLPIPNPRPVESADIRAILTAAFG